MLDSVEVRAKVAFTYPQILWINTWVCIEEDPRRVMMSSFYRID